VKEKFGEREVANSVDGIQNSEGEGKAEERKKKQRGGGAQEGFRDRLIQERGSGNGKEKGHQQGINNSFR